MPYDLQIYTPCFTNTPLKKKLLLSKNDQQRFACPCHRFYKCKYTAKSFVDHVTLTCNANGLMLVQMGRALKTAGGATGTFLQLSQRTRGFNLCDWQECYCCIGDNSEPQNLWLEIYVRRLFFRRETRTCERYQKHFMQITHDTSAQCNK